MTPGYARGHFRTVPIQDQAGVRHFVFEGLRFVVDGTKGSLRRARWSVSDSAAGLHSAAGGLATADVTTRAAFVGPNECPFRPSTFGELLVDEFFTLFHVYQLVQCVLLCMGETGCAGHLAGRKAAKHALRSAPFPPPSLQYHLQRPPHDSRYVLWYWNSYLFVAAVMTVVVLLSAAFSMLLVHKAQVAVARVANVRTKVSVLRDGAWVTLESNELVPGDVLHVRAGAFAPCDLAVLQGTCVVDESALTGESMPCVKTPVPRDGAFDCQHPLPRHSLFAGTHVTQALGVDADGADGVLAIALSTGMDTSKGDLLAAILFPSAMVFKYDEELTVVITLLMLYAVLCFGLSVHLQNRSGVVSTWVTKWIYCTSVVNQILSPLLPVALEVGQIQAMKRLKGHGVFCLQPKRIMISGKVRVYCFDKTGTLTKDGLDFLGFQPVRGAGWLGWPGGRAG